MYKTLFFLAIITITLISSTTFSQVTTIDYLSSGLSTSDCNVFDPYAVSIGGVQHNPWAGGVGFNSTNGIMLSVTNHPAGTAYYIQYNFAPGYRYKIEITAKSSCSCGIRLNTSVVTAFNAFVSNGATSCTPDPFVQGYSTTGYGQLSTNVATAFSTYNVPAFTISGSTAYPYMMIWASGGLSSLDALYISKIVITQQSFTITPSSVSYSCGSTSSQIFGISNPYGIPSITNYVWNLGSNNNWIYNGSAAPSSISTGTSPTITLTPKCGTKPSNVYATITAGGVTYRTINTASINISQPSLGINGLSGFCTGSNPYSITGLVCNSKVLWTAPPSGQGTLSTLTASPTTLNYGGTPGNLTLTANVTSCGAAQTVTKVVHLGPYSSTDYILNGNQGSPYWCPNTNYTFGLGQNPGVPAGTNLIWTVPTGWTTIYIGGNYIVIRSPSGTTPATGTLSVNFQDPCGTHFTKNFFLAYNANSCSGLKANFSIYPNPASSSITITNDNKLKTINGLPKIEITDLLGNKKAMLEWKKVNDSITISIAELKNGSYVIKFFDGSQWYFKHLIVQH